MIRGRAEIVKSLVHHQSFNHHHHPQGSVCNVSSNDTVGSVKWNNIEEGGMIIIISILAVLLLYPNF